MPEAQEKNGWQPCISKIYSFTSCFLFSVEIQTTIGYGTRHSNEICPETIVVMCLQNLTGLIVSSFAVGVVFAKLMRPKHRMHTVVFSKHALVSARDNKLFLMFRVGNVRKARIIDPRVKAFVIQPRRTKEGEFLEQAQTELEVTVDDCEWNDHLFIWPITVAHEIEIGSPLYDISAGDLLRRNMEIVVVLEGLIESTGQDFVAMSSYLTNEIQWGRRFVPMIAYNAKLKGYEVDYAKFDATSKIITPLCSAKQLMELL